VYQYTAQVLRVVDGDTLWVNLDLGFRVRLEVDLRLARINAPETVQFKITGIDDPAKKYIEECTPPGALVVVGITKAEKYGRWLAEVWFRPGATNQKGILTNPRVLNDELLQRGLALPYR
jgi:micrococcal nuclease